MAVVCAHCGSTDMAALFDSYECLTCRAHTDEEGAKTLPSSLMTQPNNADTLAQYGAPDAPKIWIDGAEVVHPFDELGSPFGVAS